MLKNKKRVGPVGRGRPFVCVVDSAAPFHCAESNSMELMAAAWLASYFVITLREVPSEQRMMFTPRWEDRHFPRCPFFSGSKRRNGLIVDFQQLPL